LWLSESLAAQNVGSASSRTDIPSQSDAPEEYMYIARKIAMNPAAASEIVNGSNLLVAVQLS
jgi:hypothetical protein